MVISTAQSGGNRSGRGCIAEYYRVRVAGGNRCYNSRPGTEGVINICRKCIVINPDVAGRRTAGSRNRKITGVSRSVCFNCSLGAVILAD